MTVEAVDLFQVEVADLVTDDDSFSLDHSSLERVADDV